jgi:hypothetical protein
MTVKTGLLAMLAAAVLGGGCGMRPGGGPGVRLTEDRDFNAVWDAAEEVLREYRFRIDRTDKRAGVMTTFPLLTRHWFEAWRKDAVTSDDKLESTLHSIYRQASVKVRQRAPAKDKDLPQGKYVAEVAVRTSRSNRPTLQVTSTADAYDLFFRPGVLGRAYAMEEPGETEPGALKSDLGRDTLLEKILQERIHRLAAKKLTVYAP